MAFVYSILDKNVIKTAIENVLSLGLVPFQYKCDYTSIANGQKKNQSAKSTFFNVAGYVQICKFG